MATSHTPTAHGVDYYSGSIPATFPEALRRAGKTFAMRYLSETPAKNLSRGEAEKLAKAGVDVGVVWETAATRALSGRTGGEQDARTAEGQAKACGMPPGRPIYFAVDFDPSPAQLPAIREYFEGAASVLGKEHTGVYGGFAAVKDCLDSGVVGFGWQTAAWSGPNVDPRAQLYQHAQQATIDGVQVDLDDAMHADYGGWKPV
jgi:hypothetical protein